MYLCIDNTDPNTVTLWWNRNNTWEAAGVPRSEGQSLVECLSVFLQKQKADFSDLKGLGVVVGRGRFTLTRVAVTVANTLAFAFRIPVIGVVSTEDLSDLSRRLDKQLVGLYATPEYSSAPRIGQSNSL